MVSGSLRNWHLLRMWKHWEKSPTFMFPYTFTLFGVSSIRQYVLSRRRPPCTHPFDDSS